MDDVAGLYEKWVVVMTKSNTFGVQIRPQETITAVVEHVLKTAHAEGLKFVRMDYLDSISVGSTQFGRFRVDDYIGDLVLKLHASGRAVIMANEGGYQVRITDRKGPVPNTTMHAIPRSPSQFRGPGAQHWTRQFESPYVRKDFLTRDGSTSVRVSVNASSDDIALEGKV